MISTPFGSIPSTNITPDKTTGIGNWTKTQFIDAMTKGISPTGKHYYPAFPYLYFSNITKADLELLFDYLQSIPPVKQENMSPSFPLNIWGFRTLIWLWNVFGFENKPNLLPRNTDVALQIGAYITNGLGHCGMCHTNRDSFGIPKRENYLAGAFIGGFWAPNITQQGLRETEIPEVEKVFKTAQLMNDGGPLAGPMADVSHNSLVFLTDRDANAVATYLKQLESKPVMSIQPVLQKRVPPSLQRGKEIYYQVCLVCHETGRISAPKIGSSGNWFNRVETNGVQTLYDRTYDGFNNMPKFGGCVNCTKNDIISAVDYMLRTSLTNTQWARVQYIKQLTKPRPPRQGK
jgi:cytochrome c5